MPSMLLRGQGHACHTRPCTRAYAPASSCHGPTHSQTAQAAVSPGAPHRRHDALPAQHVKQRGRTSSWPAGPGQPPWQRCSGAHRGQPRCAGPARSWRRPLQTQTPAGTTRAGSWPSTASGPAPHTHAPVRGGGDCAGFSGGPCSSATSDGDSGSVFGVEGPGFGVQRCCADHVHGCSAARSGGALRRLTDRADLPGLQHAVGSTQAGPSTFMEVTSCRKSATPLRAGSSKPCWLKKSMQDSLGPWYTTWPVPHTV